MTKQDMFSLLALCHSMKLGIRCYEFWQVSLAVVIANRRQCRCDMGRERKRQAPLCVGVAVYEGFLRGDSQ